MTGKRYYMTTLGDWQRHAARFANSHFIVLDSRAVDADAPDATTRHESVGAGLKPAPTADDADQRDATPILVLIEADEGVHLSLEDEPAFEALPHPLAQKPISDAAQSALAPHGVAPGATTFDAAEAVARVHPLLRHQVF
ncbi:MAG: hypothetical protein LAN36_12980 [Acidobacteriia bacterium]|nr:hypothetical protein [Terriglobia bacterium]